MGLPDLAAWASPIGQPFASGQCGIRQNLLGHPPREAHVEQQLRRCPSRGGCVLVVEGRAALFERFGGREFGDVVDVVAQQVLEDFERVFTDRRRGSNGGAG